VIAHGHYGPGGGFAGGVFVAVGAILPRLTLPEDGRLPIVPTALGPLAGGGGLLLFLLVGTVPLLTGGAFLDYGAIEVAGVEPARMRYLGILVVEVAVGLAVTGAMLLIFDVLAGGGDDPVIDLLLARYVYLFVLVLLAIGLYGVLAKGDLAKKVIGMTIFSTAIYLFFIEGSLQLDGTAPVIDERGSDPALYVDPLPHLLILTAIVVGVGVVGVALAARPHPPGHGTLDEAVVADRGWPEARTTAPTGPTRPRRSGRHGRSRDRRTGPRGGTWTSESADRSRGEPGADDGGQPGDDAGGAWTRRRGTEVRIGEPAPDPPAAPAALRRGARGAGRPSGGPSRPRSSRWRRPRSLVLVGRRARHGRARRADQLRARGLAAADRDRVRARPAVGVPRRHHRRPSG
jgi:multisubunit Na+/H+ antiporter MnhC subunit